jgi:uncharacterized protein (DUF2342 family)
MFTAFIGLDVRAAAVRDADAFCSGVLTAATWPALMRMWDDAENLPTDAELTEPAAWLARVAG